MLSRADIARRIRDERILRLWSQTDLAERAFLHLNTIYRIEQGKVLPSLLTQQRLATALGIPRVELFGESS